MRRRKRIALGLFVAGVGATLLAPSAVTLYFARLATTRYTIVLAPLRFAILLGIATLGIILIGVGFYSITLSRSQHPPPNRGHIEPFTDFDTWAAMDRANRARRRKRRHRATNGEDETH